MPERVAAPSHPCPLSFPVSISQSARKAFSAENIEAASQAERLTSTRKCSTGEPKLSTHLKQIESSSIVAISVDSSSSIEYNAASKRSENTLLDQQAKASRYSLKWRHESRGLHFLELYHSPP